MTSRSIAPSQLLLSQAASLNEQLGHENLGFLSDRCGLVPAEPPLTAMPLSHRDWDEIAADLPALFRTLGVRDALDHMPVLHAGEDHLADRYLCRAAAVLAILAHSYVRSQPAVPATLPESIQTPWKDVTRRLRRPMPVLSYIDLIVYNWRLRDADLADPMRVENLDLLLPTVGNEEERIFYLTQVEILAQSSVAVSAMTRAQTAALNDDSNGLIQELLCIHERLQHISEVSFQKISPNPASSSYVDPVVWAKTVAPFAVPIDASAAGPSGTASPLFHVLDLFFGRPGYESLLGHEMLKLRDWYPKHWTDFLGSLGQVSVSEFVRQSDNRELRGVFQSALDAYASDKGFLGTHRLKVYGYLEMAFKVGRSVTIGGFKGLFQDRTWNEIDGELALSKVERLAGAPPQTVLGLPQQVELPEASRSAAIPVTFDLEDAGVQYRPGDRCGVLPENDEVMVARALDALRASGNERVALDHHWREAIQHRHGFEDAGDLPLRALLRFGRLRPVSRDVARRLYALTANSRLRRIINARTEDQWDVPSLLQLLSEGGFDPRRLWRAEPWESDSICRIVPPEDVRLYSISSAMSPDEPVSARRIGLTVASLSYETDDSDLAPPGRHHGTSSQFLRQAADRSAGNARPVSLQIVPAPRFHLPTDVTRPIVMFAGGAGIAPFRSFMEDRTRRPDAGANWLFYGVREPAHVNYRDEFESWIGAGRLHLQVAFSAADIELRFDPITGSLTQDGGQRRRLDTLIEDEEQAGSLWNLMRSVEDGGQGALFYICGRAEFASSILASLRAIAARASEISDEGQARAFAETAIARMTADGRLMQDVFTSYSRSYEVVPRQIDASELALRNDAEHGYWMAVNGRVYDVTGFASLHPGGPRIIRQYAGIDATDAYQAVLHHRNPEVDAQLGLYEIGVIRRLDFGTVWGVAIGERGLFYASLVDAFRAWVSLLFLIVEMENALSNDIEFLQRSLTFGDDATQLTPQKIQLMLDTHRGFLTSYLGGLTGTDLQRLWAVTSGLCRRDLDVRELRNALEQIEAGEAGRTAHSLPDAIGRAALDRHQTDDGFDQLRGLCDLLVRHDKQLLSALKEIARRGVMTFERHQQAAIAFGSDDLIEYAMAIPNAIDRYHTELAHDLKSLAAVVGSIEQLPEAMVPEPTVFAGHGAAFRPGTTSSVGTTDVVD